MQICIYVYNQAKAETGVGVGGVGGSNTAADQRFISRPSRAQIQIHTFSVLTPKEPWNSFCISLCVCVCVGGRCVSITALHHHRACFCSWPLIKHLWEQSGASIDTSDWLLGGRLRLRYAVTWNSCFKFRTQLTRSVINTPEKPFSHCCT